MFVDCVTNIESLKVAVDDRRIAWKTKRAGIDKQIDNLKGQLDKLHQKKRLYSWQHAEGVIDEQELLTAFKQLESEDAMISEQLARLEEFSNEPAPPSPAVFKRLAELLERGDGEPDG